MNREQAMAELNKLAITSELGGSDREGAHIEADAVLCRLLRSLGYGDVIEVWHKVEKWYA